MNKDQALQIIEQALNVSSQKGVFGLQDSATLFTALSVLKQELVTKSELIQGSKIVENIKQDKSKQG